MLRYLLTLSILLLSNDSPTGAHPAHTTLQKDASVIILGGGMTGVIAARTLHERGNDDFLILEARNELGGRIQSKKFGGPEREYTIEKGANWVQGLQLDNGEVNPILDLVKGYDVNTVSNDWTGSVSYYDFNGPIEDPSQLAGENVTFSRLMKRAYERLESDTKIKAGSLSAHLDRALEYFLFDWENGHSPEHTSANVPPVTINDDGLVDNLLCTDRRGFKTIVQKSANDFLNPTQVELDTVVKTIQYDQHGVTIVTTDGRIFKADYALVTFSVGVLQHEDVVFEPKLPDWKLSAIDNIMMTTYTKIFFQFPEIFWFDTEMAIYADEERGRFPVWQSLDHERFLRGSGIIFTTATGVFSEHIDTLSDDEVKREALSVLSRMFPNITIPDPMDFYVPRWRSDPLFRGSFSSIPPSFVSEHRVDLKATVNERLWFAGEATSDMHFGYLQGAYFEGMDVANSIVDCIEDRKCNGRTRLGSVI